MLGRALEGDGLRLELREERGNVRAALVTCQDAAIEPYLEEWAIIPPEFAQLRLDNGIVLFLGDWAPGLHAAGVVHPEEAVGGGAGVQARLEAMFAAGIHELPHDVTLAAFVGRMGDVVIMRRGGPEAETAAMLGHEHGVVRAQSLGRQHPLFHVHAVGREGGGRRVRAPLAPVVAWVEDGHVEVDDDAHFRLRPSDLSRRGDDKPLFRPQGGGVPHGDANEKRSEQLFDEMCHAIRIAWGQKKNISEQKRFADCLPQNTDKTKAIRSRKSAVRTRWRQSSRSTMPSRKSARRVHQATKPLAGE